MSQLDPMYRYGDNPRSTTCPTVEHRLPVRDDRTWSPRSHASSTASARSYEVHDPEDVRYHSKKLTVLARVKEKARSWRFNIFIRKKHSEGDNTTPSWGVRLEDEYEDEDPEYFGAPSNIIIPFTMLNYDLNVNVGYVYESELAPEGCKGNARQNPRAIPVIPEKHVLASSVNPVAEQGKNEPTSAETKAKNSEPANAMGTDDDTQEIASKIQGLSVSDPTGSETEKHATHSKHGSHEADKYYDTQETNNPTSPKENKWDKGASVKEFIMNKLEPGEDEKALSEVISDGISPRRTAGDVGMMGKVKGAVNSLLWREEPAQSTIKQSDTNSSPQIPVSTNAQAVMKEDNKGTISKSIER